MRALLLPAMLLSLTPFSGYRSSVERLPAPVKRTLVNGGYWQRGCPVGLRDLRLLTVTHRGFDRRSHRGQMVVNKRAARPLARVFRQLYRLHFPMRHMTIRQVYGRGGKRPTGWDPTGSFECRQAVPSPCSGGSGTGSWSNHAYGLAVDVNPVENPYVGCGMSRDPRAQRYRRRTPRLPGMVTRRVVKAFASIGWGWGAAWAGSTKDYMHFSVNGR